MTEPTDSETRLTYETAIRSFTEAEIALREIVSALERYRAASVNVEQAGGALASANAAVIAALAAYETTAGDLATTATALREASTTIAALDPERFWSTFEELRSEAKTADIALGAKLDAVRADLSGEAGRTREQLGAATGEVRAVAIQARAAAALGAVAAILAVVACVVLLLR